jgi:hypothetical protein
MDQFLGKPFEYWLALDKAIQENQDNPPRYEEILLKNHRLVARNLLLEARIKELHSLAVTPF